MGRRDEGEVTIIESDAGAGVRWFLLGAIVGAAAGLLLAPESGERTRRKIGKEAKRLRREASDRFEDIRDDVADRGRHLKSEVEDWAEGVRDEVREGRKAVTRKASAARDDLERRLADVRSRRRAAVAPADGASDGSDEDGDA